MGSINVESPIYAEIMNKRKLLLVSSSRVHGTGFLEHCSTAIKNHFPAGCQVLFVPYALADHDKYEAIVREPFEAIGLKLKSIHQYDDPQQAIAEAQGIFIGGGNSFRLLKTLYDLNLIEAVRSAVENGTPYMGSSAGTNMACPTIRTTNDMPILEPPSLNALNLIPFQINPHYLDADPNSTHKGETRAQRLSEYHEENNTPVAGLREGSWLEIHGDSCTLRGKTGMVLFRQGQDATEFGPDTELDLL